MLISLPAVVPNQEKPVSKTEDPGSRPAPSTATPLAQDSAERDPQGGPREKGASSTRRIFHRYWTCSATKLHGVHRDRPGSRPQRAGSLSKICSSVFEYPI